jgi:hypothetical protein
MVSDSEYPTLSTEEAWRLPESALREKYWTIASDLLADFGQEAVGHLAPKKLDELTRGEIMEIVRQNQYWFNPEIARPANRA